DKVIEWGNGAVKLFWEEGKVDLKKRKEIKKKLKFNKKKNNKKKKLKNTSALKGFKVPLPLREQLQRDERVKQFLLKQLAKTADEHKDRVRRFEIPKGIVVFAVERTDQNGCMTPSYKKKRDIIRNKQKDNFLSELKKIEDLSGPVLSKAPAQESNHASSKK
ncbi:MAG: hypothetical protein EZS28_037158, partial [Streblomastix strix]